MFRNDPDAAVVAFTAAQIPGIADRRYPASLAGPRYPDGIAIIAEDRLPALVRDQQVDEVVLAYSDLAHTDVMHKASIAMAAGADFRLVGPRASMLRSAKPVVAVCATRTGAGKSQTSRCVGRLLIAAGLDVALVRHPMPYGDLEAMRVQRFATLADIDAADPTIEEREEYEEPVRQGMIMYAGVDYEQILRRAETEADVIVWDGGNNDFPFFASDLLITVTDPLRPGHELAYHPGEINLRMADVVIINKVDVADPRSVSQVAANVMAANPAATLVKASSPVTLDPGAAIAGSRVLVVEDGPTLTHGGMPFGAGTVAARHAGACELMDPRLRRRSDRRGVLRLPPDGPAAACHGYGRKQVAELEATIAATPCDVVVTGTPIDLRRIMNVDKPVRRATYELREIGSPTLGDVLAPLIRRARSERP